MHLNHSAGSYEVHLRIRTSPILRANDTNLEFGLRESVCVSRGHPEALVSILREAQNYKLMRPTVQTTLATILVAAITVFADVVAIAQVYRPPPPLPGPYSFGYSGCPGGYISISGDVCQPYFPPMHASPRRAYGCPPHYKLQDGLCKRNRRR